MTDLPGVDLVEAGALTPDAPVVLFVPGSYSTPAAWRGIQKRLAPRWRLVATSILGYGATRETRRPGDLAMDHEVAVLAEVGRRIGRPVHLVGHSFGATVALAAALARALEVASIATFEANPIDVIRGDGVRADAARNADGRDLYALTRAMCREFEAAIDAGEGDAAGRVIDFWGGPGAFQAMPEAVRDYCRQTVSANRLDWHTCFGFDAGEAAYRALACPVLLVRGGNANDQMVAITGRLAGWLPNARTEVVEGAGHFLITSHAEACARLLTEFLDQNA